MIWDDADDCCLRVYLRRTYTDIGNDRIYKDVFQQHALNNSFNVIEKHLKELPEWDKTPRAETLFTKFLRVEDNEYSREVTMNWLFGAIARALHPGCEYQTALVLNGEQKIGKSTIAKLLGGEWHAVLKDSVEDSHAIDVLQSSWIVELEEFWAGSRASTNALEAFISANADDRREAYARKAKKYPRHCVFIITCNDQQFLKDRTGNRRFMVLKCLNKQFEYVEGLDKKYIEQVWAEALYKFKKKFADGFDADKLQLSREAQQKAEEISRPFVVDDSMDSEIHAFLDIQIPHPVLWKLLTKEERRKFFTTESTTLEEGEWMMRRQRFKSSERAEFDKAISDGKYTRTVTKYTPQGRAVNHIVVYGSVYRTETCASEIFNECFGNDSRRSIYRINEVLSSLSGWSLSDKQAYNFHHCYGNQKRVYLRPMVLVNDNIYKLRLD